MKTNKETVLDTYEAIAEKSLPGKGSAARATIEKNWDKEADAFCDAGRISAMGYKIDAQFTVNCVKGIVTRKPAINNELKALKS